MRTTEGTGGEGWRHRGGVCLDEGYGLWGRASRGLYTAVGKLSGSERVGSGGVGGPGLWACVHIGWEGRSGSDWRSISRLRGP